MSFSHNYKTPPFPHQAEELARSADTFARAIFWEQGTGKSKLTIDTAAHKFLKGDIDGVLVIAPNGVHENWITDELPAHLPDGIPIRCHSYSTRRAQSKAHKTECDMVIGFKGLAFLAMSYDAFMTDEGRKTAEKFLARRKTLYVLDESQRCKSASAKRTRAVVASGRRATHKRILSGTPITNKPFDIYPQLKFLDEELWKRHGFASYEAFKTYFGIWEQRVDGTTGGRFMVAVAFRNLDQLKNIVATIGSRVTKEEVLDLPPKIYTKRYFELSPEQARAYKAIKDEFMLFLESGEAVTAPLVITRLLRLQQISCGYLPSDDDVMEGQGGAHVFPENPRLKALADTLEDVEGKALIFARFRRDIDQIMGLLGAEAVRYDGAVGEVDRLAARKSFQEEGSSVRYFVANPAAASTGLTLHAASTVIYYSNSFNLEHRLQSEDRAHRIGQKNAVRYIDLVAKGTVDAKIVYSLRSKLDIASKITGDQAKEWLTSTETEAKVCD